MLTAFSLSLRPISRLGVLTGALALAAPAAAELPRVEPLLTFTATLPEGGNGAMPGSGVTAYDKHALLEGPDGSLYGIVHRGIGDAPLTNVGGNTMGFYQYHPEHGQTVLEQRATAGNAAWRVLLTQVGDQLYDTGFSSTGGLGLHRFNAETRNWETLWFSEISADRPGSNAWLEGANGVLFNTTSNGSKLIAINPDQPASVTHTELPVLGGRSSGRALMFAHSNGRLYGYARILEDTWIYNLFSIAADGSDYRDLVAFDTNDLLPTSGLYGLVELPDGRVMAAVHRGDNNNGRLVLINVEATGDELIQTVHHFGPTDANIDGRQPNALILGQDGHVYGTTTSGGINDTGTLFRWHQTDGFQTLYAFDALTGEGSNYFGIVNQYTGEFINSGQNKGSNVDGMNPNSLIQTRDGSFYGLTALGGEIGWGTLFRFHPGDEVPVFNFDPKLSFSINRDAIALGQTLTFTWRGQKVSDCQASSNESGGVSWSGARNNSQSETYTPTEIGNWTYTLTCQSENGPLTQSVQAQVVPVQAEPDIIKEGGGALGWLLAPLGLLGLARRQRNQGRGHLIQA